MTIATTTNRVDAPGNGSATAFSFAPVVIFDPSNLQVTVRNSAGIETSLTQGAGSTNYSVVVTSYPGTGSIVYPASGGSPLPTGSTIVIKRIVPITQSVSLGNQGAYFPKIQEGEFDYLTSIDQQQQEQINRTVQVAPTDAAIPILLPTSVARAGKFLGFDGSGNPMAALPSGGGVPVSTAMAPVVGAASLSTANVLLGPTSGAPLCAWWFGCIGDGVTDDTANLRIAKAAARAAGRELRLVGSAGNSFKITSPIAIVSGDQIVGAGTANAAVGGLGGSVLVASGNFTAVLTAAAGVANYRLQDFAINVVGTTTQCLRLVGNSTSNAFALIQNLQFIGSSASTLVYSSDSLVQISRCVFYAGLATTVAVVLDGNNLNTTVTDCVFLGGSGIEIVTTNVTSMISSQGIQIKNNVFANFNAPYNILVSGAASYVTILGNVLDQAAGPAIILTGAVKNITIQSNYLGQIVAVGPILNINETCSNLYILGNTFGNGAYNIVVGASVSSRAGLIMITDNNFGATTITCMSLDSVNGCTITGNIDNGTLQSYQTLRTNSAGGAYDIGGNYWSTAALSIDSTSSYRFRYDRGATGANRGRNAPSGATTALAIAHGCAVAPNHIVLSPNVNTGAYWVSAITSTNFTVTWTTSSSPVWSWSAEYYM